MKIEIYIFGHLRSDNSCYNPFAYSTSEKEINEYAKKYIDAMKQENSNKINDTKISFASFGKILTMGTTSETMETFDYIPENWNEKCVCVSSHAAWTTERPSKKDYNDWILVMIQKWNKPEPIPLFMPKQSFVFQGLGNGFYLKPKDWKN